MIPVPALVVEKHWQGACLGAGDSHVEGKLILQWMEIFVTIS